MTDTHPPSPALVDGTLWVIWKSIEFAQYMLSLSNLTNQIKFRKHSAVACFFSLHKTLIVSQVSRSVAGCHRYDCSSISPRAAGLAMILTSKLIFGKVVAERLQVPFLVIDFAETADGRWIVIECNDGQDSGYAGVSARQMWRTVIEHIKH